MRPNEAASQGNMCIIKRCFYSQAGKLSAELVSLISEAEKPYSLQLKRKLLLSSREWLKAVDAARVSKQQNTPVPLLLGILVAECKATVCRDVMDCSLILLTRTHIMHGFSDSIPGGYRRSCCAWPPTPLLRASLPFSTWKQYNWI